MMRRTLELMFITWLVLLRVAVAGDLNKPNCRERCGNITIDYPFGLQAGCHLNERGFKLTCEKDLLTLPAPPGSDLTFIISQIRLPNQVLLETSKIMAVDCRHNQSINPSSKPYSFNVSISLPEPFMVSARSNRFRAMGCDTTANIKNTGASFASQGESFASQCETQWMLSGGGVKYGGLGQCQIAVPEGSAGYAYSVTNQFNYNKSACWRTCSYSFLAAEEYKIDAVVLDNYVDEKKEQVNKDIRFPLVGEWVIKDGRCNQSSNGTSPTCGENALCNYTFSKSGYNCHCKLDYEGNPYLKGRDGCRKDDVRFPALEVALAGGFALAATLGATSYTYGSWAQKKLATKLASKFLRELASSGDSSPPDIPVDDGSFYDIDDPTLDGDDVDPSLEDDVDPGGDPETPDDPNAGDKPRDFNQQDLKKAIKIYRKGRRVALWASRRIVAKANLANNQAVEVRKYTVQDRGQLQTFVKGVRTLSRTVNHANVAMLLGISTRESSLVYRYFSDKTLRDRLHKSRTDRPSWEERLKIAVGAARGLTLAHSKGIYHGNVKSSNILLDKRCNCKVIDFGVVRVWRKNKLLNSSEGYVDPEYFNQSGNQLTATMDVYSFGVVLVELITGQDPSAKAFNQRGRTSLAMLFMLAIEKKRLEELVDSKIWAEERRVQLQAVADVAAQCLQLEANKRPTMLIVRDKLWKSAPEVHGPTVANRSAGRRPVAGQSDNLQGRIDKMQSQYDKVQGQADKMQDQYDRVQSRLDGMQGEDLGGEDDGIFLE